MADNIDGALRSRVNEGMAGDDMTDASRQVGSGGF